jgi:Zn ribbon nucleic-acid-binding protein
MERVIDCPVCYDQDSCFEDIQEEFKSYMCFNCGFMSSTYYTKDSDNKVEGTSQLVNDLKFFDKEREIYWYPSVVNMGKLGIIYPEGSVDNWKWRFAVVVEVEEDEKESYPVLDEEGKFYTEKLDVENAMEFGQYEFMLACKAMGIVNKGFDLEESLGIS